MLILCFLLFEFLIFLISISIIGFESFPLIGKIKDRLLIIYFILKEIDG